MRPLVIVVALVAFPVVIIAAEPAGPRAGPPTTIQSEEPDVGEEDEGAMPELRDEDDGLDDGRDLPSAPIRRGRPRGVGPEEDQEEPPLPPERSPSETGPAQPASAMQPASPH